MFSALVLAATANIAAQFFHDFGGNWTCGNGRYHSQWSITSPDGNYWTIVRYGADAQHPDGTAYVGWLPQSSVYVYNDYHNDGGLAQLTAPAPGDGVWHWKGDYFAAGAKTVDNGPDITWTRKGDAIVRTFAKRQNGKLTPTGNDTCTKLTP